MSACTSDLSPALRAAAASAGTSARGHWLGWLARTWQMHVTRGYLAEMDARMLKDIGVSSADAGYEASRMPWDQAPRI